ncbi:MAG: recombination mediator RecR [Persicimonas sp.]
MQANDPITRLVSAFAKLPGIGERTARRLAFFVLDQPDEIAGELAEALVQVKEKVGLCERCCNLTDSELCSICRSKKRDHSLICVVENTPDLHAIENTGEFQGAYHVLHGLISPLEGIGPDDIHIRELIRRLESPEANGEVEVEEIIVATSPSVDGEATSLYLSKLIKPLGIEISRIASGVPIGSELEYTDKSTLSRALSERRAL